MVHDADYLASLADKVTLVPSRGGALFQNIQSGGRQSLTHLSKPSIRSTLKASLGCFSCVVITNTDPPDETEKSTVAILVLPQARGVNLTPYLPALILSTHVPSLVKQGQHMRA